MDSYMWFLVVVFGVVIVTLLWATKTYNRLVRLRNRAAAMWAEIDVELKRRHDLVPNLVSVVSGYAGHERGTLEEVTQARNLALAAHAPGPRPGRQGTPAIVRAMFSDRSHAGSRETRQPNVSVLCRR